MAFAKYFPIRLVQARLVAVLALLFVALAGPAMATDRPVLGGGGGGGPVRDLCPAGKYLIGVNGNYGFVVDRIALICAAINSDGTRGEVWQDTKYYGGAGGSPLPKTTCGGNEIIYGLKLQTGDVPSHTVVRQIVFTCISLTNGAAGPLDIGVSDKPSTVPESCTGGEAVTGLQIKYGTYVDAVGLICGPVVRAPAPAPSPVALGVCTPNTHAPDERTYQMHNDGGIWVYNKQSCTSRGPNCLGGWNLLDANRATVQIASYCELYQLRNNGLILHYTGQFGSCLNGDCTTGWKQIDSNPQTTKIVAGAPYTNSSSDAAWVYQMRKDGSIWRYNDSGWDQIDNDPAAVSMVGGLNGFYKLHRDGKVYRWNGTKCGPAGCAWTLIDQNASDPAIMISAGNGLYQLRKSGAVLHYANNSTACASAPCPGWNVVGQNLPTPTVTIKAGFNDVYRLQANGNVYILSGNFWTLRDNHPETIAITAGRLLYETRKGGNIFYYSGQCPVGDPLCPTAFGQLDQNASSEGVMVNDNSTMH
jgi:hypothetical protein